MVQLCFILLLIGIICLIVEMFIPGFGVFGISGIVLMLISAVLAVLYVQPYGWYIVAAEVFVLTGMIAFMFNYIKRKQLHGNLIMNENLNDDIMPLGDLESLIGKEGISLTSLRPFGVAGFNGTQVEVASSGPFVDKGTRIVVTAVEKNKVIVNVKEG